MLWMLDSPTTSLILNDQAVFNNYLQLKNSTVKGIGQIPASAIGIGLVSMEFDVDGKKIQHNLKDVSHVPEDPNCLVFIGRFDENG